MGKFVSVKPETVPPQANAPDSSLDGSRLSTARLNTGPRHQFMFIDEVRIRVKAGDGGNGCLAFRREKYVPRGGPSGGDGGRGGDVIMEANPHLNTLLHLRFNPEHNGQRGRHGEGSNCSGQEGTSATVKVPVGTVVYDEETGERLFDFTEAGQSFVVARGGRGGRGNATLRHFHSPGSDRTRSRASRSGKEASPRTETSGGCGPGRLSQRRQIHADLAHLGGAPQDRRLSVHHSGAESGSRAAQRFSQLRGRRYARPDRRRAPGPRSGHPVSAPHRTHAAAGAPGRHVRNRARCGGRFRYHHGRTREFQRRPGTKADVRGRQQNGRVAGSGTASKHCGRLRTSANCRSSKSPAPPARASKN